MATHEVTITLGLGTARTIAGVCSSACWQTDHASPTTIAALKALGHKLSGPVSGRHSLLSAVEALEGRMARVRRDLDKV